MADYGSFASGAFSGYQNTMDILIRQKRFNREEQEFKERKKQNEELKKDRELQRQIIKDERENLKMKQEIAKAEAFMQIGDIEKAIAAGSKAYSYFHDGNSIDSNIVSMSDIPEGDRGFINQPSQSDKYIAFTDRKGTTRYSPVEGMGKYLEVARAISDPKIFGEQRAKIRTEVRDYNNDFKQNTFKYLTLVKNDKDELGWRGSETMNEDGTLNTKFWTQEEAKKKWGEKQRTPEEQTAFDLLQERLKSQKKNTNLFGIKEKIAGVQLATANAKLKKELGDSGYDSKTITNMQKRVDKTFNDMYKQEDGTYRAPLTKDGEAKVLDESQQADIKHRMLIESLREISPGKVDAYEQKYNTSFNPPDTTTRLPGSGLPLTLGGQNQPSTNRGAIDPNALVNNIQNNLKGGNRPQQTQPQPIGPADPRMGANAAIQMFGPQARAAQQTQGAGDPNMFQGRTPQATGQAPMNQTGLSINGLPNGQPSPVQSMFLNQAQNAPLPPGVTGEYNTGSKPALSDLFSNIGNITRSQSETNPLFGEAPLEEDSIGSVMFALRKAGMGGKDLGQKRFMAEKLKAANPGKSYKQIASEIVQKYEEEKHPTEKSIYSISR